MSLQVAEITNFKSGKDLSVDPILAPSDAFVNLRNGYVYRGVLRSRKGVNGFATGLDETNRTISRLTDEITNEAASTGDGGTDYSFTLANTEIERLSVVVTAGGQSITFSYAPKTKTTAATGDTGAGTNNIDYQTGDMNVSFAAGVGGGTSITVTYNYYPNLAVMGIHEYVQTPTPRDLIVCDEDFPYIYDGTNDDFDRIAFAGGVGPFTGGTSNFFTYQNWRLRSRGAVPAAAGALALSDVLFMTNNQDAPFVYDGTNVDLVSNMPEFRQPAEGTLDRALHVMAYGERLIWIRPRLNGIDFAQSILYGPINDSTALALDYQDGQAGLITAATDSIITSIHYLRDTLIVFFETDVYALEITDDAFAPFRWTRLEYERGVSSTHSAVGFFGNVEAVGRLGIIGTDGRRTSRVDNRIPEFTRDEIDPTLIDHVYGEEIEDNSQFWWTYPEQESIGLTTSNKVLVKNFEETNFSTYDLRLSVFNKTIQGNNRVWDNLYESFAGTGDGVVDDTTPTPNPITSFPNPKADVSWDLWGLENERYKTIAGDHNGFIFQVDRAFQDSSVQVTPQLSTDTAAIKIGSTTTIETEFHSFQVDDEVLIINVEGTVELNGQVGRVTSVPDRSSIVVNIDSTNYTAYTGGGQVSKVIDFEATFVPFSPARPEGQRTYIGKIEFLVKSGTGEYTIDFFQDRDPEPWSEPSNTYTFTSGDVAGIDRWFSIYVDQIADFHTMRIKQKETNEQIAIKSIRIHWKPAGESNV